MGLPPQQQPVQPTPPPQPVVVPQLPPPPQQNPMLPKVLEQAKLAQAEYQRLQSLPPSDAKSIKEREIIEYLKQLETLYTQLQQQQAQAMALHQQQIQAAQQQLAAQQQVAAAQAAILAAGRSAGCAARLHRSSRAPPAAAAGSDRCGRWCGHARRNPAPAAPAAEEPKPPPPPLEPRKIPANPGSLADQLIAQRDEAARQHMHFRPGYQRSQQRNRQMRADVDMLDPRGDSDL